MIKVLKDAFKVKEIRSRILFTLMILFVFRIGSNITIPGINVTALRELSGLPFFNLMNMVSGSAMQKFSLFSLGVSPYITASIVIQLLQMDIVPKFVEWSKQGEVGRQKLNKTTAYLSLVMAFGQSWALTAGFNAYSKTGLVKDTGLKSYITIGIIMAAGTMFVTWLGEQISEKGIGNGVSMIIFSGIVAGLPTTIKEIYEDFFVNVSSNEIPMSILKLAIILLASLLIITFVTYFQQAERKIPIQYTKRVAGAPQSSYLPIKVNAAGVIPVIFASSILATPSTILGAFASKYSDAPWYNIVKTIFDYNTLPGATLYLILIVLFTFFYAFVQVNPEKLAENLQKQGSYIPSVRPGKETENYVSNLLKSLSTVGAVFLAIVAIMPIVATGLFPGLPSSVGLGGTSLLIIIGVALEFVKQLEGLMLKRKYVGFINK